MKLLLLLILIPLPSGAQPSLTCTMGGYNYNGTHYSDRYQQRQLTGVEPCHQRTAFDEEKIKQEYLRNKQQIESLINEMLNTPRCSDVHDVLKEYLNRLRKHEERFKAFNQQAIGVLKDFVHLFDIQRQYAFIGAFSATCSGGHDRKTSFIDLDTINKIPVSAIPKTVISEDGQTAENCADVMASGSDDLNNFNVSLKQAKGDSFKFSFDPFGIPDQVIVSSSSGNTLYDSGCTSSKPELNNVIIPLSNVGSDKAISIRVKNNCSVPNPKDGFSSWVLRIQCQQDPQGPCDKEKQQLVKLIKEKIERTKVIMDSISDQRRCFSHLDETVLKELEEQGLIGEDDELQNDFCETLDEECEAKIAEARNKERIGRVPQSQAPVTETNEKRICPPKPKISESLLDHISYAYCTTGAKRLGLD